MSCRDNKLDCIPIPLLAAAKTKSEKSVSTKATKETGSVSTKANKGSSMSV